MNDNMKKHVQPDDQGYIIGSLLVLMLVISVLMMTITSAGILNFQGATRENARVNAQFSADSGLDQGISKINQDATWPGTGYTWDGTAWVGALDEEELFNDGDIRTTYEVSVSPGDTDRQKIIRSVGRTYKPVTATTPSASRIFEIQVVSLIASNTSIVTGVGGLIMDNSSKIVDGSVFANGSIRLSNTAQIGTTSNPLQIFVANNLCPIPADASFPRLCNSGENNNPIAITSPNAYIYGEVNANYQSDDTNMFNVDNPSASAIVQDSGVATQDLPLHDRAAMIAGLPYTNPIDSSVGTPGSVASCTTNSGSVVWGGSTGQGEKIRGDVVVSNKCRVEIRGPVWITGSLIMNNSGTITVSDSLGANRPVIMIDSQDGFKMNQSSALVQNTEGTNVQIITYWSNSACSPDCTDVSGTDLFNSQSVPTIDIVNAGDATEAIFYAKWSKVIIRNSVNVGALVGQVVQLEQSATIAFSSSLPGFTPRTTWVKRGYLRVFQ